MPKESKSKKKSDAPIKADIKIDGNVSNANIIVGHGNTINVEAVKTVSSLLTIPLPVKDFTGREDELAQLKTSFKSGAVITGLSGGGGVGKTELARRLAQEIADAYPDARMSIDLLGTSETPLTSEEVMRRILEPFYPNQQLPDQPEGLQGLYQQTFASKKALLLLDNAANAAQVRPLIPPPPSAAIVTSRQHFALTEFDLTPLRLDVLSPEKSREFLRSASIKLKDAPDEEIDALATLCGRLPLALRVAASLLDDRADWTPGILLKRLEDERTRLSRLQRENDPDLDVESVLSLSYNLLDNSLKEKFRQLGVFTAPFMRISAQAVWELENEAEADDLLGKLANRSLLNVLPSSSAGLDTPLASLSSTRPAEDEVLFTYTLHDLTRLFALERLLDDESEAKTAAMRHADHFLGWASAANTLYKKGNENILLGLAQFRFIWAHLQSAYERLLPENTTFPRPDDADRWLGDFPGNCVYVLDLHLPPRQKIPLMQAALSAARRLGERGTEGVHLGNLGLAYAALGDARKAIEFHEQYLAIAREIGDRRGEGNALGNLGLAYADLGDAHKAIEFYEQALVIDREIGDRRGEGADLGNLGLAYADLGDARKAIEFYEQRLEIAREIGDRRGEGNALGNLGLAYAALGDARKAIEFYEQNLAIAREIGDRRGEGNALGNLGNAYAALGDARKAIEFYEQALVIDREIGDRRGEGADLGNLGLAYAALGDARKAIEFHEQYLAIAREIGDRRGEGNALGNLGNAYAALGDARKAIEFYEQNLAIAREIGDRRGEGNALGNLGSAYFALKEFSKAGKFYEQQMAIVRDIGDKRGEGNALWGLAICKKADGKIDEACALFLSALKIFKAIESPSAVTIEKMLTDLDNE
jgi:tetratricopeptide (TPR) repeat protein